MFNLKCIIMLLFNSDSSQSRLISYLNRVLFLLYHLDSSTFFIPMSSSERHDLVVCIRLFIRFGKALGCHVHDVKILDL